MRVLGLLVASVMLSFSTITALAQGSVRCDEWVARLVSAQGEVLIQHGSAAPWVPASLGQTLCLGDSIRVEQDSRAALELRNDTLLRLDEQSTLLLPEAVAEPNFWVNLLEGALHLISRVRGSLEVRTPFVNAGREGTEFVVRVLDDQTIVSVIEGRVAVSNPYGRLSLVPGQTATAQRDQAPVLRIDVQPQDAVQWAIHYPLVVARDTATQAVIGEVQGLLVAGRVDRARERLGEVLAQHPDNAQALALNAIIAVAQNDVDEANRIADLAVSADPADLSARLALSYARQSRFDLPAALVAAQTARDLNPEDALAWVRIAELEAAMGETRLARDSVARAIELAPDLSRGHSVLGFLQLGDSRNAEAADAFATGIVLDPTDPLPRVGQALSRIRAGKLSEGRRDLEIAASLDPANSLVRSYLGKAYLDERRGDVARVELANAKALDSRDPTPWYYEALASVALNDPIAALHALGESVRLNDNRAVVRSRLLLDQDQASQSADQGQIFRSLGFERLIPPIAASSLIIDPASAGIHRLQASAARPREQAARVSELLQWQLNAPLGKSILPLQQTEAELPITAAADLTGSAAESARRFATDGPAARLNAVVGANDLVSNDLTLSYQAGPLVFGLGQYHYRFDGYAVNNDQRRDILGASLQWQLSPTTTLFTEYRDDSRDFGDLGLGHADADIATNARTRIDTQRWRLGARHALTPSTTLLGTLAGFDKRERQRDLVLAEAMPIVSRIHTESEQDGWLGELQLIQRTAHGSWIAGLGHYRADSRLAGSVLTDMDIPGLGFINIDSQSFGDDGDDRQHNAYAYRSARLGDAIDYTLGLAYDDYSAADLEHDQFSPKFGLIWRPVDGVTLRAMAARGLKRALVAEQTLEPTQVAGFTQMFDEPNGTDSHQVALAVDTQLSSSLYAGAEWRRRDLRVPFTDLDGTGNKSDWDERNLALYAYWMPTPQTALRVELLHEDLDFDRQLPRPDQPWSTLSLETRQLPVSLAYFSPLGYTAKITTRWVDQKAELINTTSFDPTRRESDSFWTTDIEFDYRLPKVNGRVALGVRNLFDKHFGYQEPDIGHMSLARERTAYLMLNLAL